MPASCAVKKMLVNIAPAIPDVHASSGLAQKARRLPEVIEPANAFLLLDQHAPRRRSRPARSPAADRRKRPWEAFARRTRLI